MYDLSGFVKLHRKIMDWRWYKDSVVKSVFIHCLIKAAFKAGEWQNRSIGCGQFITSYSRMANELGISVQQLRTALKKLEETGEITREATKQNTLISIVKWDFYQNREVSVNKRVNTQSTNYQQHRNNYNNYNNYIYKTGKKEKNPPQSYAAYDLDLFEEMLNRDD